MDTDQNKEYVLKLAHDNNVKFIRLWFTDVLGFLKSFAITIDELEDAIVEGVRFDGSTLQGFIRTDEREMIALPDISTFKILPWRPKEDSVARMFCDIYQMNMTPYECDSRQILKKNLQKAAAKGFTFYTGPEIEFFYFKNSIRPEILDQGGYFDLTPLDAATDYRRWTVLTLEKMGIDVISSHHEASNSQHEIDLRHEDAFTTADNIMTFKLITKEIALMNNIHASFMPKPLAEQNGSGLHIHQSLFKDDRNMFYDRNNKYFLSETAERYIAGLLAHCNEFFVLTNQWINSYKRLHEDFESPTHATWSCSSLNALVRVPLCRPDKPNAMRIELQNPDPACNPYLVFSAIIAAGMKGIDEKYRLAEPVDDSDPDRRQKFESDCPRLPTHLHDALRYFEKSALMKETLGEVLFNKFIENKSSELKRSNRYITDYEIKEYLPIL
ncbi:MAG: glutamine synthetase [Spirochaetes bacterium RBG_16_49_21]|nr:MAG: glutamine synthetase [Spirochaetes bacterium RBG_16_49_21]